jgi:hypothetical protein
VPIVRPQLLTCLLLPFEQYNKGTLPPHEHHAAKSKHCDKIVLPKYTGMARRLYAVGAQAENPMHLVCDTTWVTNHSRNRCNSLYAIDHRYFWACFGRATESPLKLP